jgi:hypothetical protein
VLSRKKNDLRLAIARDPTLQSVAVEVDVDEIEFFN